MQPKSSLLTECPAARALETVGEWWSILILRDAFQGVTRFDEFAESLGIAPNILSRRLSHLTAAGMFSRRRYNDRPPRYEYVLTPKGRDFFPVLVALFSWGNKHLAPKGEAIVLASRRDSRPLDPIMVDAIDMHPITPANTVVVAGPRASRGMRTRLASLKAMNPDVNPAVNPDVPAVGG
jgi:DNA-binding HxlR family transcriptional regulator